MRFVIVLINENDDDDDDKGTVYCEAQMTDVGDLKEGSESRPHQLGIMGERCKLLSGAPGWRPIHAAKVFFRYIYGLFGQITCPGSLTI